MGKLDILICEHLDGVLVGLGSNSECGDWPFHDFERDKEIDFVALVAEHLVDGEVAVLMTAGAEKLRYVTGRAVAFTNAGHETLVAVDIDDIYAKAKAAFGVEPTMAQY